MKVTRERDDARQGEEKVQELQEKIAGLEMSNAEQKVIMCTYVYKIYTVRTSIYVYILIITYHSRIYCLFKHNYTHKQHTHTD